MEDKSKLTLIVDGNWLLMSRFSVIRDKYLEDDELCRELQLMMIKSINVVLRTFPSIDNIIFVSDGGSWRNDIPIPKFILDEYKGNREQDPNINWKMIFEYYEDFIKILSQNNITTCQVPGVEGDDWCWYWSTKLNKEGTNCIIWSMDKDLTQLVHTDTNTGVFTVCWNKSVTTVHDIDYNKDNIDDLDFFFGNLNKSNNDKYLHEIISKSSKIVKIDPHTIVVDKIIRGDKGDNILPIILRRPKSGTSEKLFRVSTKDLDNSLDIHNENQLSNYISNIIESNNYKNRVVKKVGDEFVEKSKEEILEHLKYNIKLVALEKESYPDKILEAMNSYTGYVKNKNISEISSYLSAKSKKLSGILDII